MMVNERSVNGEGQGGVRVKEGLGLGLGLGFRLVQDGDRIAWITDRLSEGLVR